MHAMIEKKRLYRRFPGGFAVPGALFFLLLLFSGTMSGSSSYDDLDKRNACEELCKNKNWNCRQKAYSKNEKDRSKSVKICESFFTNCMGKCQAWGK